MITSTNFGAHNKLQLQRIYRNSPHSRLLLYDYSPITEFAPVPYDFDRYYNRSYPLTYLPATYAVAVPINTVLAVNKKDTRLYKFGLPFSYQLALRYFHGFDLDFNEDAIREVKGFAKDKLRLPNYTVFITISPSDKPHGDDNIDVNQEIFQRLK